MNISRGKIYGIQSLIGGVQYIGSTCQTLELRMRQHVSSYRKYLIHGGYTTKSHLVLCFPDAEIKLIENCSVESVFELRAVEGQYITNGTAEGLICVNKNKPTNIETGNSKEYYKEYYIANKPVIQEANWNYYHSKTKKKKGTCHVCDKTMTAVGLVGHKKKSWSHQINMMLSI